MAKNSALIALISLAVLFAALRFGSIHDLDVKLVFELRLPRLLLAIAVGAGLAVAGTVLQAIFSNPLCEPYTLGISSGASLGAVLGSSFHFISPGTSTIFSSLAGAGLFTLVLVALSWRAKLGRTHLLLSGVMLSFLGSSLIALWMALTDAQGIQSALSWLLGDLSRAELFSSTVILFLTFLCGAVIWVYSYRLDAYLLGEETAATLHVNTKRTRNLLIVLTSFLVGLAVSFAGIIGFIGLLAPHLARKWVGPLHRSLIPASAWLGAVFLICGDLIARTVNAPQELPVGVVTALVGAPVFIWFLFYDDGRTTI